MDALGSPNKIMHPWKAVLSGVFFFLLCPLFTGPIASASARSVSAYHIDYTPQVKEIYFLILDLKMHDAERQLQSLKKNDPFNQAILHLENLKEFLTIFINENAQAYAQGRKAYAQRIRKLNAHKVNGPFQDYINGQIHLQWGILHLKFGNFYNAFIAIKKAYHLFYKNHRAYPDFLPTYSSLGILHALIGTIPAEYQWGLQLLTGMEGDLSRGQEEIEHVLRKADPQEFLFYRETLAMYVLLQLHLKNNPEKAWQIVNRMDVNPREEPLTCFALANLAMRTGRNDLAIQYLENRPRGTEYMEFPYMEFMLGTAYLRKLDKRAITHLKAFVRKYPGHNYVKEAYQKIAWYAFIFGNKVDYHKALDNVLSHGTTLVEADKSAEQEAKLRETPNKILLKAQLLFDGGYYKNAYTLLLQHSNTLYQSDIYSYEYIYRLGRILDEMREYEEAIGYYKQAYQVGIDRPEYYACNAALHIGKIKEQHNRLSEARKWYKRCLALSPDNYSSGIHQQAEAGLERIAED